MISESVTISHHQSSCSRDEFFFEVIYILRIYEVYPVLSQWNVSSVANVEQMLAIRAYMTMEADVSKWNVSAVTRMTFMFRGSFKFKFKAYIRNWDVSAVQ